VYPNITAFVKGVAFPLAGKLLNASSTADLASRSGTLIPYVRFCIEGEASWEDLDLPSSPPKRCPELGYFHSPEDTTFHFGLIIGFEPMTIGLEGRSSTN
jgi:hypothetical protein